MLTEKQHELLKFICHSVKETGISPSFDEMRKAMNLKSKSGIHRLVTGLEERGYVRRLHNRARAVEVIRSVDVVSFTAEKNRKYEEDENLFEKGVCSSKILIPKDFSRNIASQPTANDSDALEVPFYGKLPSTITMSYFETPHDWLTIPMSFAGHGAHFAVEVADESMSGSGIQTGDVVVFNRTDQFENGDMVLVLVGDKHPLLRSIHTLKNSIALKAKNDEFGTQIFGKQQVTVLGRVISSLRRF